MVDCDISNKARSDSCWKRTANGARSRGLHRTSYGPCSLSFPYIVEIGSHVGGWRPECCSTMRSQCSGMCGYTECSASVECSKQSRCFVTVDCWEAPGTTTHNVTMPG